MFWAGDLREGPLGGVLEDLADGLLKAGQADNASARPASGLRGDFLLRGLECGVLMSRISSVFLGNRADLDKEGLECLGGRPRFLLGGGEEHLDEGG